MTALGATRADLTEVERIVRRSGTSFARGMRILPADRRAAMYGIYAFCRLVDDVADEGGTLPEKKAALQAWRDRIQKLGAGGDDAVTRVLALATKAFDLREADMLAVIDGMEMDAEGPIIAPDFNTLDLYCDRVASAVGRLSVRAFGDASTAADQVAHHLGRALQLTNILRDLGEDSALGRLYLPREWLFDAGVPLDPEAAIKDPRLAQVCERLVKRVHMHFGGAGAAMARCNKNAMRPARLMAASYAAILARLERRGWRTPAVRVSVPLWGKTLDRLAACAVSEAKASLTEDKLSEAKASLTEDKARSTPLGFMAAFGFASGLPLPLTIFTLQQWFATYGLSLHAIGLTSWIGLAYTLKFLWSALFDRPAPGPLRRLGRRRGWLMLVQPAMVCACAAMAFSDPSRAVTRTVLAAMALAFLSASQDILIDAWRIETYEERRQGAALAAYIWGYRGAMLVAGSGVIFLSTTVLGWHGALLLMAALMGGGTLVTMLAPDSGSAARHAAQGFSARIEAAFIAPLHDFLGRPAAWQVLAFIVVFRLGHMAADTTAAGFYRSLQFDSRDVATANFLPSLIGTLSGAIAGGWLVAKLGTSRGLLLAGTGQAMSLALYLALLAAGHDPLMLSTKVGLETFAGAAADTAFLTYLSSLCSSSYTATQYALLSSLAALALHTLGGLSGYAAEALGYRDFYAATILAGVPALLLLRRLPHPSRS